MTKQLVGSRYVTSGWLCALFALVAAGIFQRALAAQPISGVFYDIMGNGQPGYWVGANQDGVQDSVLSAPQYELFAWTSDVPEDPNTPETHATTWGRLKASFRSGPEWHPRAKSLASVIPDGTLEFNGGSVFWSVTHTFGNLTQPLTFNVALPPKVWTLAPHFIDVQMDVEVIKQALFIGPPPFRYADNLHWPSSAFPLPVDGESWDHSQQFSGAMVDSLSQDAQMFVQRTGVPTPFQFADGQVQRGINGIWWVFDDNQNLTEFSYDSESDEIYAATIHTKSGYLGWDNRNGRLHEEFRAAFGLRAPNFQDPPDSKSPGGVESGK